MAEAIAMHVTYFTEKVQNSLIIGEHDMIILLLILAYSMSEASADNIHVMNTERPGVDIVRQLDYVQRMSDNHAYNASGSDTDVTDNSSIEESKRVNVSNGMSVNRVNALRNYISGKTVGLCDFSCLKCYRCTLIYGNFECNNKESYYGSFRQGFGK